MKINEAGQECPASLRTDDRTERDFLPYLIAKYAIIIKKCANRTCG